MVNHPDKSFNVHLTYLDSEFVFNFRTDKLLA